MSDQDERRVRFVNATAQGDVDSLRAIYDEGQRPPSPAGALGSTVDRWTADMSRSILSQALQEAAANGSLPVVQQLLEWGVDVNLPEEDAGPDTEPALFRAVVGQHSDIALALLVRGARPDWRRSGSEITALFPACAYGLNSVVAALLAAGADPNVRDVGHLTPLLFAVTNDAERCGGETVRLLLDGGADLEARDDDGRTMLHLAAARGNLRTAQLLLDGSLGRTADVEAKNKMGRTAFFLAVEKSQAEMARFLLAKGADFRVVAVGGWTALHAAAMTGDADLARLLMGLGADVNAQPASGTTPLHWAAINGRSEVVRLLLANGDTDPTIKDSSRRTPLVCAAEQGHIDVARLLTASGIGASRLSAAAKGACLGFQATLVDVGQVGVPTVLKRSVYDLLYGWDNDTEMPAVPIMPEHVKNGPYFRWIHLPANNIDWVETLLTNLFAEEGYRNTRWFKALGECFGQVQRGRMPHRNAMRPFCRSIQPLQAGADHSSMPEVNTVLFMPFIHYETVERHRRMADLVDDISRGTSPPLQTSPPDLLLASGYLNRDKRPLHVRRTLDQYSDTGIDTSARDADQVVTRYCQRHNIEPKLLMVDQLWLWVIGKDLVITCFAERWEQPKLDPLNVVDGILEGLNLNIKLRPESAFDLATRIIQHCCSSFARPRVDPAYQFLDMFESSAGRITNMQTRLLNDFSSISEVSARWLSVRQGRHPSSSAALSAAHKNVLDSLLEISTEISLLREMNDIREELSILNTLISAQSGILETFASVVADGLGVALGEAEGHRGEEGRGERLTRRAVSLLDGHIRGQWHDVTRKVDARLRDVQRMDRRVESTYSGLRSLLELKQMQSNALEAKFARDRAVSAAKQGQAVLVFTVVTIVFLPISFVATLFTINIDVWGGEPMTLSYVTKYVFGIGLGISIPLVVMALTVADIVAAVKQMAVGARNGLLSGWNSSDHRGLTADGKAVEDAPSGGSPDKSPTDFSKRSQPQRLFRRSIGRGDGSGDPERGRNGLNDN